MYPPLVTHFPPHEVCGVHTVLSYVYARLLVLPSYLVTQRTVVVSTTLYSYALSSCRNQLILYSQLSINLLTTIGYVMHQQFNLIKPTGYVMHQQFNLIKPTGYVMHQQFNLIKPTGYVMHQQVNL